MLSEACERAALARTGVSNVEALAVSISRPMQASPREREAPLGSAVSVQSVSLPVQTPRVIAAPSPSPNDSSSAAAASAGEALAALTSVSMVTPSVAIQALAAAASVGAVQLCAVPKKRTTIYKRRLRREGQWRAKAKTVMKVYRVCVGCGKAVEPAYMCQYDNKCLTYPRV